jgi:hypothetical protein
LLPKGHIYESLQAHFDRDDVALPGLTAYFRKQADGERTHARNLMAFLNQRGGRVALEAIPAPHQNFSHEEKGDALNAMEMSLALEKLNFERLNVLGTSPAVHVRPSPHAAPTSAPRGGGEGLHAGRLRRRQCVIRTRHMPVCELTSNRCAIQCCVTRAET